MGAAVARGGRAGGPERSAIRRAQRPNRQNQCQEGARAQAARPQPRRLAELARGAEVGELTVRSLVVRNTDRAKEEKSVPDEPFFVPVLTDGYSYTNHPSYLLPMQLCGIMHSSWIFPRDNEWIFSGYRALMDLGPNSGPCSGLDGPSGSCPSSGIRAGSETSEDSLDRRRVDPGSWRDSSSEAWRSRNRV